MSFLQARLLAYALIWGVVLYILTWFPLGTLHVVIAGLLNYSMFGQSSGTETVPFALLIEAVVCILLLTWGSFGVIRKHIRYT